MTIQKTRMRKEFTLCTLLQQFWFSTLHESRASRWEAETRRARGRIAKTRANMVMNKEQKVAEEDR